MLPLRTLVGLGPDPSREIAIGPILAPDALPAASTASPAEADGTVRRTPGSPD